MKTIEDICHYITTVICDKPIIVETGCVYGWRPDNLMDGTTNNLARICHEKGGSFYSLDNNPASLLVSSELVKLVAPLADAHFMRGESVLSLHRLNFDLPKVDVLCLDSEDGVADHAVAEFLAIKDKLNDRHFIMIDDLGPPPSPKATDVVDLIKSLGYEWRAIPTPMGMFFASKGYPLP